jgi:hypothetical protein
MERETRDIFYLRLLFPVSGHGGFNVGAFSPRDPPLIHAVLEAADYLKE